MYKKRGIWYTSVQVGGKGNREFASLQTRDKKEARVREPKIKNRLYHQIITNTIDKRKALPSDKTLVSLFLKSRNNLAKTTRRTYFQIISNVWLNRLPFPPNPNTQICYKKHINVFYRWANERYRSNFTIYKVGEMKGRIRVYSKEELESLFTIPDKMLVRYIKASYFTGAREGELLRIKSIHDGFMIVGGKSYERIIKLSKQAQELFKGELWDYMDRYKNPENEIQKLFRRHRKKLGIKNATFHDLRRTFGYNLIVQGMPIYQVSKLLGHKSVRTTERHYAPLLVTEVQDFQL